MAVTVATAGLAVATGTAQAAPSLVITPVKPCHISRDRITATAAGFTPNGNVNFSIDGQALGFLPTDATGSVPATITLGSLKGVKTHTVQAVDQINPALTASSAFVGTTRQVTVKPQHARAGKKLKLKGYGFVAHGKAYMHVRGHGLHIDTRVGKSKGPCGTWTAKRSIVPSGAAAGKYPVQFDQKKKFSKKTKPRVRGTMTVTRTFSAFGGAGPIAFWTQVG
jgi:hypothetical protein